MESALELYEEYVGVSCSDVLANVGLGRKPERVAGLHDNVSAGVIKMETSPEGRQRVHDAVGVPVALCLCARRVAVLQHPHAIVLEDRLVLVGVGAVGSSAMVSSSSEWSEIVE